MSGARPSDRAGHEPSQSSLSRPVGDHPIAQFTPGPWRTEIDNVFAGPDDYRSIYIADCAPLGGPVDGEPTTIANASLIAAAPELYEALRELLVAVRFADPPKDYGDDGNHGPNLCHEARIPVDFVTIAERALAKARGQ